MTTVPVAPRVNAAAAARVRKQHRRRRTVKVIMSLFVLGGLVYASLTYGRSYLFPEDWPRDVVPTVEALQQRSGLEFADPVAIVTMPDADYAAKIAGTVFGPSFGATWTTSVPRWRALGLVDGEPVVEAVNAVAGAWLPAHYDPADGQIYRSTTASGPALDNAMENALAAALVAQQVTGSDDPVVPAADATAPASIETASLARLAVADLTAELVAGPATADTDRSALGPLPVPMAHRLIGAEDLGAPILESLGVTPDRAGAVAGFDVDVATVLDVPWTAAPVPGMIEGDLTDGAAAAVGSDYWYMVLAAYLPADTAAEGANSIGADLYTPAIRGAQQCVYGTFTPATPELLGQLQVSLGAWAELAPTQAAAKATTLADGVTVQLSTCDPGTAADAIRTPGVASALVDRQIARLASA
jgi:hypothetical protein